MGKSISFEDVSYILNEAKKGRSKTAIAADLGFCEQSVFRVLKVKDALERKEDPRKLKFGIGDNLITAVMLATKKEKEKTAKQEPINEATCLMAILKQLCCITESLNILCEELGIDKKKGI